VKSRMASFITLWVHQDLSNKAREFHRILVKNFSGRGRGRERSGKNTLLRSALHFVNIRADGRGVHPPSLVFPTSEAHTRDPGYPHNSISLRFLESSPDRLFLERPTELTTVGFYQNSSMKKVPLITFFSALGLPVGGESKCPPCFPRMGPHF